MLFAVGCSRSPSASAPMKLVDAAGKHVPQEKAEISKGPAHCDWTSLTFVFIDRREYVADPQRKLPAGALKGEYADRIPVPSDARDTGYHVGDVHLYEAADRQAVYLLSAKKGMAQRLSAVTQSVGCD
ncbi:MAG: hypothetical protein ABI912_12230 [Actinomycetota bacterium]